MNIENVLILVCKLIQSNETFLVIFKHSVLVFNRLHSRAEQAFDE